MRKRTSAECPFCHGKLEREERPVLRSKAAYRCVACNVSLTKEMSRVRLSGCETKKIWATIEMSIAPEAENPMEIAKKLLENASITVSNELCEVKISNIKI